MSTIDTKFGTIPIDIGDKPTRSLVLRDGLQIKAPELNPDIVNGFVGPLGPIGRVLIPRVLVQGVAPGTKVPRGTVIDITCVPSTVIPFNVFQDVHPDFVQNGFKVSDVAKFITDNNLSNVLSNNETSATLNQNDRGLLAQSFERLKINTDSQAPNSSFENAFQTLRNVQVFL